MKSEKKFALKKHYKTVIHYLFAKRPPVKHLRVLGTRGIPAQHGGFETFAQRLALFLTQQGWHVTVYCQCNESYWPTKTYWNRIELIHLPAFFYHPVGTAVYDLLCVLHASLCRNLVLTLGYNTAIFCLLFRLRGICNVMNMDGFEWKRKKWSWLLRQWFRINERLGIVLADHLIADHPAIKEHLDQYVSTPKSSMIPYGAMHVSDTDTDALKMYNVRPREYFLVIARPEPENSIFEIVEGFSRQRRGVQLVVLGKYLPSLFSFHKKVVTIASDEVIFPGAIFDLDSVNALRSHCLAYIHGHQVGGTNPSLVEALAAGSPVLAHDNVFNRWVAGSHAAYFLTENDFEQQLNLLLTSRKDLSAMQRASREQHARYFTEELIMNSYEQLLSDCLRHNDSGGRRSYDYYEKKVGVSPEDFLIPTISMSELRARQNPNVSTVPSRPAR